MSNAPKEITTPPEGYEWTGEWTLPTRDPILYAKWFSNGAGLGWKAVYQAADYGQPVIRKIKPPTVMVELPREWVEWFTTTDGSERSPVGSSNAAMNACCKALEAEND